MTPHAVMRSGKVGTSVESAPFVANITSSSEDREREAQKQEDNRNREKQAPTAGSSDLPLNSTEMLGPVGSNHTRRASGDPLVLRNTCGLSK